MRGSVTAFDEQRGLGEIAADDTTVYPFHCTVIADGTRSIRVGAAVDFEIVAGPLGTWQATAITPVGITPIRDDS